MNSSVSSVAQSCLTLCDPMDCSTPGFPVHHQLPEHTQTHVHWVSDAIQPSHPLSSPSPPAFNLSQHQGLSNESALCIRWPKYWSFSFSISLSNEYSGWFPFVLTDLISLLSKWLSRVFSNTTISYTVSTIPHLFSVTWWDRGHDLRFLNVELEAKVLEFQRQHQSFQRTPRTDLL